MNIKGKLRKVEGFTGRSVEHKERTQENIQSHIDGLHANEVEKKIKTINQKVEQGTISPEIGKFLKKNL